MCGEKRGSIIFVSIVLLFSVFGFATLRPQTVLAEENSSYKKTKNAVVLYINSPIAYVNNQQTLIDPNDASVVPIIKNSRTLVPLRFISEAFGADVSWDDKTKQATILLDGHTIVFTIGKTELVSDGKTIPMDTAAEIIQDRVYIPLRAMTTAIGKEAFYDRGLIIISDTKDIYNAQQDKTEINNIISKVNNLPVVGSQENLEHIAAQSANYNQVSPTTNMPVPEMQATTDSAAYDTATMSKAGGSDFSTTNVQVQGVDEGDIVKTDGEYIYSISGQTVSIVHAVPAENMTLDYTVMFEEDILQGGFYPQELYIDGNYMLVIGQAYMNTPSGFPVSGSGTITSATIYDTSNKSDLKKVRQIDAPGYLVSSRKIDETVYLITNETSYTMNDSGSSYGAPQYKDSTVSNNPLVVGYDDIYYFPTYSNTDYTIITGFDMTKPEQPAIVNTFLGAGGNVYASTDNLYIATTDYPMTNMPMSIEPDMSTVPMGKGFGGSPTTTVYKFSMDKGDVTYQYRNTVNGTVLNQFSMDEYNQYFRIATTSYDANNNPVNNLYVLDEALNTVGQIEDIAPGETIYSTRFVGDRAYMVTFRTVDPLFVIDLHDPTNPTILGALKIPGYSNYLHPYDENHIIGFGKDTAVDKNGNTYPLGMKISMFDVTDVNNPKEMFTENIGDSGTESPLFYDHKSLLFSKEKNLMAFPVQVAEVSPADKDDPHAYGQFTFQGAYVYNVDLENGFVKKGEITHMNDEDMLKASLNYVDYDKQIQRILFIDDTLYTVSNDMIKATGIDNMQTKGEVLLH